MNQRNWRLILDGAASGARNMARDEALWHAVSRGEVAPTLRFYAWEPHCLSLGRLQRDLPLAVQQLQSGARHDFACVRRPTGGRAVWHADEITYALALPLEILPETARGVNAAYEWLSRGFLRGLQSVDLPVELSPHNAKSRGTNCFEASAACDFVVEGRKLIGAAQCRNERALLQHGSILRSIDRARWSELAGGAMENAVSLEEISPTPRSIARWQQILACGFEREFGVRFEVEAWSEGEACHSAALEAKYASSQWNFEAKIAPD